MTANDNLIYSIAAYSLQQIGLLNATDIIGGYEAWKNAGLPIDLDRRDKTRSFVSLASTGVTPIILAPNSPSH